jgi:CheY-like chemotaxis protein
MERSRCSRWPEYAIEMPGEDGYALIRKVRDLPPDRGGQTPAAALTGLSTPADRARAPQAGFQEHLAKPIDAPRLVGIVTTLAARGQAGLGAPCPGATATVRLGR